MATHQVATRQVATPQAAAPQDYRTQEDLINRGGDQVGLIILAASTTRTTYSLEGEAPSSTFNMSTPIISLTYSQAGGVQQTTLSTWLTRRHRTQTPILGFHHSTP